MPRRSTALHPGYYYHVYNRGVNRGTIFFEPDNYGYFIRRMEEIFSPEAAILICFCLMPNHCHLLVQVQTRGFSVLMQRLGMSYANAINKRYRRTGPLFEGRFQAKVILRDEYLLHLSRYIHLNPVKAGLVSKAEEWAHSSCSDFVGVREHAFVQPGIVLDQLGQPRAHFADRRVVYRQILEDRGSGDDRLEALVFEE